MRAQWVIGLAIVALDVWSIGVSYACAADPAQAVDVQREPPAAIPAARTPAKAIESGLSFLVSDTIKWRAEKGCATCHHGTMTVWALGEAKAQGYPVQPESFAEIMEWTKGRMVPKTPTVRDQREGWRLVGIPAIYLAVMSQNLPVLSRDELNRFAVHLARHQEEDGSFLLPQPAANGAPPVWESPETLALWALLAWAPSALADSNEAAEVNAGREKTVAWLDKVERTGTTQSLALRLLLDVRMGKPPEQLESEIGQLVALQKEDGGWSQTADRPSDALATGQVLYALSFAGVTGDRPEIQRAIAFLTSTQREDGSWPMTSRNHPGVVATKDPIRWPVPITYFGTAWAMLGLVRHVPSPADTVAKQQQAFDSILGFHGKYDVDETAPDRPVIGVDLRYYEVSDTEVGDFANWLQAFPRMTALQFKSTKITDLGLAHLRKLLQLRSLAIENAMITDAGLAQLKDLTLLETLDLKGTQVTEAAVQELQQALPNLKVER